MFMVGLIDQNIPQIQVPNSLIMSVCSLLGGVCRIVLVVVSFREAF